MKIRRLFCKFSALSLEFQKFFSITIFLTVGQNNFGNKIPFLFFYITFYSFFTEGRCLLELTHRSNTEGNQNWIPTTKKVYWPPPGPVKAESSPSVQSGKTLKIFKMYFFAEIFQSCCAKNIVSV